MLVDATQFLGGTVTDMCGAIAAACGKLGATGYPQGATIDARGFTGIKVCQASTITTMLSGCVGGSGHNGGKLLLGNVNLYADGPILNPYYTDGTSTVGTPALIIPAQFWGIEGISRGSRETSSTSAAPGTFLSVCTGLHTPVSDCTTAFPQRSLSVTSTTASGNTMTMTVSPAANFGTNPNIYPGELVMLKGNGAGVNGMYKVQKAVAQPFR
jgi:hypothetical protein